MSDWECYFYIHLVSIIMVSLIFPTKHLEFDGFLAGYTVYVIKVRFIILHNSIQYQNMVHLKVRSQLPSLLHIYFINKASFAPCYALLMKIRVLVTTAFSSLHFSQLYAIVSLPLWLHNSGTWPLQSGALWISLINTSSRILSVKSCMLTMLILPLIQ